ncbi:MAG: hypothetical protein RL748_2647, partial [Pseudomonadota bacterium]
HALFFKVMVYDDAIRIKLFPNPQRCPNSLANAITARLQQAIKQLANLSGGD